MDAMVVLAGLFFLLYGPIIICSIIVMILMCIMMGFTAVATFMMGALVVCGEVIFACFYFATTPIRWIYRRR